MHIKAMTLSAFLLATAVMPLNAATVSGTVKDSSGSAIVGAVVTITSFTGGKSYVDTTIASGVYTIDKIGRASCRERV
jgi:hypothetical protein